MEHAAKFSWTTAIHFDELDPMLMLHNSRFSAHVERAISAWFLANGRTWERDIARNPDQFHVVRDLRIEYLNPFIGTGSMRIDIWVERLGNTSCSYGFLCSSDDGNLSYARGQRTIVKLDPKTHRPVPWSDFFRQAHERLRKDLPAHA